MKTRVILSDAVCDELDRIFPRIGGVRRVKIYSCSRLPFSWLPGFGNRFDGLTLWRTVYIHERVEPSADNRAWLELLVHELVHVEQFMRNPLKFPLSYLWHLAKDGYHNHPAEIEARERAAAAMSRIATPEK